MCGVERCTECGSKNILHDEASGEVVCRNCGLVLGAVEFTAPADRTPKSVPSNPIAYTSTAVGSKILFFFYRLELFGSRIIFNDSPPFVIN
ncbi:MAG: hypothetical protein LBC12_03095 [Nitrososphaerota archaeon]|nr:hypothetical protein [Nitrososphaerota archaeon]